MAGQAYERLLGQVNTEGAGTRGQAGDEPVNGLIQHSFALRIPSELNAQYLRRDISDPRELLHALFEAPGRAGGKLGFRMMTVGEMARSALGDLGRVPNADDHSLLVARGDAAVSLQGLPFLKSASGKYTYPLPAPFSWAQSTGGAAPTNDQIDSWEGFVSVERDGDGDGLANDFLIVGDRSSPWCPGETDPVAVSWLLCQLLAHRRSRLFGLSLARRVFNVLLPHALLRPSPGDRHDRGDGRCPFGSWIVQPALSLFRANEDDEFRRIFSLTLFMIPVTVKDSPTGTGEGGLSRPDCDDSAGRGPHNVQLVSSRAVSKAEIYETVQAGWSLTTARPPGTRPLFTVSGPLCDYLSRLDPSMATWKGFETVTESAGAANRVTWSGLTLRKTAEAIFFEAALRMVEGPSDKADRRAIEQVGGQVLTALSASRVSCVVAVDKHFDKQGLLGEDGDSGLPGSLEALMAEIAGLIRLRPRKRYRLDRFFFDDTTHAIGVLPANSCVVLTSDANSQLGRQESGLLQAGWIAYMAIGAAMATGMVRSIYDDIEKVDDTKPKEVAEIEREVVVDLHEIYDLDITWEQYRHRYYLLRDRLGITRDYKSLQVKLEALSRESSTRFEGTAQRRLIFLTAAIVFLTLVVAVMTVLVK
jgi:hypothetical protein